MQVDTISHFTASLTPPATYASVSGTPSQSVQAAHTSPNSCPYDTAPGPDTQGSLSTSNSWEQLV